MLFQFLNWFSLFVHIGRWHLAVTQIILFVILYVFGFLCLNCGRLWDLGQQRCVHSYAVHTDSIWALASNPTFSHVYSGGRDLSVSEFNNSTNMKINIPHIITTLSIFLKLCVCTQLYLTDLSTRESVLLCTEEHPILQLGLHDDGVWVATSDSSVHRWPAEPHNPLKVFQKGGSFLAGNLSFSRARVSLEGSTPVSYFTPSFVFIS